MKFLLVIALGVAITAGEEFQVLKKFASGNIKFTADVYKELLKSNSHSFSVCPLSVNLVLGLIHAGAKGKTAQELAEGLNLPKTKSEINEVFTKLIMNLKGNKNYDLTNANKIYVKDEFKISNNFKNTAVGTFKADIENINFQSSNAANRMNKWVETKTSHKIKGLIKGEDLKQNPSAVIINAMYFRGKWKTKFDGWNTKKRAFQLNERKRIEVEMMEMADEFNIYESAELNAKFLEMPYEGDDVTMTFVLPNGIEGLSTLEARIAEILVRPKYHLGRAHVIIPKFKIETTIQFKPILKAMGIVELFSNTADFTEIGANQEPLKISKVIQKTFIEVEEEGTIAAAGTAGFSIPLRSDYVPPPVLQFVADHPFMYFIKIKDIIVFVGRYVGP